MRALSFFEELQSKFNFLLSITQPFCGPNDVDLLMGSSKEGDLFLPEGYFEVGQVVYSL